MNFWSVRRAALLALSIGLAGCQTIEPKVPKLDEFKPEPPRKLSTVAVPVRISAPTIAAIVEEKFPAGQRLYWTTNEPISGSTTLQLGIYRTGNVDVSTDGGCINIGVQLAISDGRIDWVERVRVNLVIGSTHVDVKKHFDFGGSGKVSARVCPTLSTDWQLGATIQPSFSWIEGAYVDVGTPIGSFKIGVSERVEPKVREQLGGIAGKISDALAKLPLKDKLGDAWGSVQKPILLAKKPTVPPAANAKPVPEVYLVLEPTTIGLGPLQTQGAEIVATPIVSSYVKLQLGKPDSTSLPEPKPLPKNAGPIAPQGVNASVLAVVPYDEANKAAEKALRESPIDIGDKKLVSIKSLEMFPDGERVMVKVGFAARLGWLPFDDTTGYLYLRGIPRYSNTDRIVSIENLGFDIDTDNLLVKSAELLKNPLLMRALEKKLRFELGGKIDPIVEKMMEGVAGQKLSNGALLNARATSVELSEVHVGPKAISVRLYVKGDANIAIEPIKP